MSFRPPRTLPILTLFHNARVERSRQALQLLQNKQKKSNGEEAYRIDVVDENNHTTTDTQLQQVASFLNSKTPWKDMISPEAASENGITDPRDAFNLLKQNPNVLRCPIVVDWEKGKAALGSPTLDAVKQLIEARNVKD
jgi:arsenate reductase-like glutaredoxin family protein